MESRMGPTCHCAVQHGQSGEGASQTGRVPPRSADLPNCHSGARALAVQTERELLSWRAVGCQKWGLGTGLGLGSKRPRVGSSVLLLTSSTASSKLLNLPLQFPNLQNGEATVTLTSTLQDGLRCRVTCF